MEGLPRRSVGCARSMLGGKTRRKQLTKSGREWSRIKRRISRILPSQKRVKKRVSLTANARRKGGHQRCEICAGCSRWRRGERRRHKKRDISIYSQSSVEVTLSFKGPKERNSRNKKDAGSGRLLASASPFRTELGRLPPVEGGGLGLLIGIRRTSGGEYGVFNSNRKGLISTVKEKTSGAPRDEAIRKGQTCPLKLTGRRLTHAQIRKGKKGKRELYKTGGRGRKWAPNYAQSRVEQINFRRGAVRYKVEGRLGGALVEEISKLKRGAAFTARIFRELG